MTNEEFQILVLEKLGNLEEGQKNLNEKVVGIEEKVTNLEEKVIGLEEGQKQIFVKLDAVVEQTMDLTEFRYEVKEELADIKSNISRIEIATADNWGDIARLKAAR
ncbi:hypothetical protein RBU61_13230 [Tissierella sp. MB52-C2]|uniref:hypothetical protein n=1 Tax=Tissierella sp. MB52-C2 TaxID=3070999 RepID=UPI00280B4989|nr:hypothetical protein [Tissierella sp. MB52-C2]WMM23879.1 hypothetical protein RBU61_13230 [Tissierella sp. MB52-C2]